MENYITDILNQTLPKSKYLSAYIKICQNITSDRPSKQICKDRYTWCESHHIVPVSIINVISKDKNNIAHCTPREHFILHKLLMYSAKNTPYYHKCRAALLAFMRNNKAQNRNISSRDYELLRKLAYENARDNKLMCRFGDRNGFYGKIHSYDTKKIISEFAKQTLEEKYGVVRADEIKNKMSESRKTWSVPCSNEKKKSISETHKGKIWITDGKVDLKIRKQDQIPSGWYRGRTLGSSRGGKNIFSRNRGGITQEQRSKGIVTKNAKYIEQLRPYQETFEEAINHSTTYYQVAKFFNDRGITQLNGNKWQQSTIKNAIIKLGLTLL